MRAPGDQSSLRYSGSTYCVARTDRDGRFRIAVPANVVLEVAAQADGYLPEEKRVASHVHDIELSLRALRGKRGRIVDFAGTGLAGVQVALETTRLQSDAQGYFELKWLDPREAFSIGFTKEGYAMHVLPEVRLQALEEEWLITMVPQRTLNGRVIQADETTAVGVQVRLQGARMVAADLVPPLTWERWLGLDRVTTDAQGEFAFEQLYEGDFRLEIRDPQDDLLMASVRASAGQEDLLIRLGVFADSLTVFRGVVRAGHTKTPIENAHMHLMQTEGGAFASSIADMRTGASGAYEIQVRQRGQAYLSLSAEGFVPWEGRIQELDGGILVQDVELLPARRLLIRVLDRESQPLAGARLRMMDLAGNSLAAATEDGGLQASVTTDAHGWATLNLLPADRLQVAARAANYMPEIKHDVDLRAADQELSIHVDKPWYEDLRVIALVLRIPRGLPMPDTFGPIRVEAYDEQGRRFAVQTLRAQGEKWIASGTEGTFLFDDPRVYFAAPLTFFRLQVTGSSILTSEVPVSAADLVPDEPQVLQHQVSLKQ